MRTEELIRAISEQSKDNERFEDLKRGMPLGIDTSNRIILAQPLEKNLTVRNTCITGVNRSAFIRRFLVTLSCLYEKNEACFFVLSPRQEYGELLRLHSIDVTVPYINSKTDFNQAIETIKELLRMREYGSGYPRLFIIVDGLEELPDFNFNNDLAEYRELFDLLIRKPNVELITGVDLARSIFSGYPGAFLGIGNCLVTVREEGKADVTYVNDDSSMSLPAPITYPSEPTVMESIIYLNALPTE